MFKPVWMKVFGLCIISVASLSAREMQSSSLKKVEFSGFAQGTTWHLAYYATDTVVPKRAIDSILVVVDNSLSLYKPHSLIVHFNNSEKGVTTDEHLRKIVERSLDTYKQTGGLFDITVLPLIEAWGFGAEPVQTIPDSAIIRSILSCVGSAFIQMKDDELIKLKPCVKIDVNGIGQGYTVDVIASFLERAAVVNYIVELGGELRVCGKKPPENTPFKIGIEVPSDEDPAYSPIKRIVTLESGAITTSGNYRNYHESRGKRISHLMDPRTGYPVENELISVTVYAGDATTADAYDNALMSMGLRDALAFAEKRNDMAVYCIYHSPDGSISDTASSRFYKLFQY